MYENQSASLSHAQKLRLLQGKLTQELLGSSEVDAKQVARDIGLTNDSFVTSILNQDVYAKPVISLGGLISQFPDVKRKAMLGEFASENTLQMYLYAHGKLWLKEKVIGTFVRGLSREAENVDDKDCRTALRLDHAS